jgi:hypothetical protein
MHRRALPARARRVRPVVHEIGCTPRVAVNVDPREIHRMQRWLVGCRTRRDAQAPWCRRVPGVRRPVRL